MTEQKICEVMPGTLFVVATPIGNLEDITLRAVRVLGEVDFVASEDTRHTRKLLSHLSLSKPLISYYKDKETSRAEDILEKLLDGQMVLWFQMLVLLLFQIPELFLLVNAMSTIFLSFPYLGHLL